MKRAATLATCLSAVLFADAPPHEMEMTGPNPPAGPVVTDWSDFYFTGEFIWWKAQQDGLAYTQSGRAPTKAGVEKSGSETDVDFDFEPGFKIGAGVNWRYDGWDVYVNYTWLNPAHHSSSTFQKSDTGGVQASWMTPFPGLPFELYLAVSEAKNRWKLDFNTIDTELGRNFFVSSKLTLRPFFGFKAAWINQTNRVLYFPNESFDTISEVKIKMKQDFTGFGIRGGINTAWRCSDNWSIFGNAALSELWCKFENHRKDRMTLVTGPFTNYKIKKFFHGLTPALELALGLRYTHDFKDGKWRLDLSGAWELQTFFAQNRFLDPIDRSGNLTLQGATARIGFAF